ncbi:TPA: type II toxin-antitoxin system PemK/MazF family toxin [Staphylococcus aureus]|uniref:type II toxin-antitoxin system PemK/MazF family toxin n=1 Tax=Staphylococcus aureus TaxID=1280 RepID=UPI003F5C9C99|nr:type II toxin-antitoxin system PemK/MazF family toxin [Staphylococcus aureus]
MSYEMFDEANDIYKTLFDSGKDRFKGLPYWHRSKSNWLFKEYNGKISNTYNSYKRGTIIYVDFGINVGSEISGGHFAIVLNKNDNKKSSMLNVIPLSSKDKKYYLSIDKTVFENASNRLKQSLDDCQKNISKITSKIEKLQSEYKELYKSTKEGTNAIRDKNSDTEITISDLEKNIEELKVNIKSEEKLSKEIENNKNMIEKVYLKYSKYDKQTFACYKSLHSISKLKVRRINKYDPSGKMKVDNSTLEKLDKKILEEFTNIKID